MTRLPTIAILVALPSVTAWGGTKETREQAAPITIYTQFEQEYSGIALATMRQELQSIMGPIGLAFEWKSLKERTPHEVAVELVVVTFKGSCRMDESTTREQSQPGALGWTHTSDGAVLPFSDVECDRIRRFIGPLICDAGLIDADALLGRAMGRVLAHELYHIFANTRGHGRSGVAKPFYTSSELISDEFVFERRETEKLRREALPGLIRAGRQLSSGMPSAGGQ